MGTGNLQRGDNYAVSVITCTKRFSYIKNVLRNYKRQKWPKKELIIIINNDDINMDRYLEIAKNYQSVSVYRLPSTVTLGKCINFGVKKAKYEYIAKFDDDDYYAPHYLSESIQTFHQTNADVIGKKSYFIWLSGKKLLVLRFPKRKNKYVDILPGATLVIKKCVFDKVKFPDLTAKEDVYFCLKCKAKGFTLYSGGRYNFVAVRRKFSKDHTWIISEEKLIKDNAKVFDQVKNYKAFVSR